MLKILTIAIITVIFLLRHMASLPLGSRNEAQIPLQEMLQFMQRFGYLGKSPNNSEALYHESAIVEAIKNVQKYGSLRQTGKLDVKTLELFSKPRCGVPDITDKPHYLRHEALIAKNSSGVKSRQKRYSFGGHTWRKRNLKYFIGNWSKKISREAIERGVARALGEWSKYSNLKFHRVYDRSADINIGFASGNHGDNDPFDGPGNVYAHAFFPNVFDPLGGDAHFDEDEDWLENASEFSFGVDFYSLALHEFGHSLGLEHSPDYNSVMYAYYRGPQYSSLNNDDKRAMYDAYYNKRLAGDFEIGNEDFDFWEDNKPTKPPFWMTSSKPKFPEYPTISVDTEGKRVYDGPIPNICEGKFNAMCYFNGAMHIFKGAYVWRLSAHYRVAVGYPKKIDDVISDLPPNVKHVDACYQRSDKTLVIFSGKQVLFYKEHNILVDRSITLQDMLGDTKGKEKVNAVILWPKNNRTYIFADTIFWRYNDYLDSIDKGYPKAMIRWRGIPENIDAAATLPNGKTYFFKDNRYWLYNNFLLRPERGYPRRASTVWLSCNTRTKRFPFRTIANSG